MTITHNQIVQLFEDLSTNHFQINGFGFGDPWEYLSNNTPNTPCLWGVLNNTQRNKREVTLNYSLLIFDLVKADESNENEVLSDTHQIALDLLAMLGSPTYSSQFFLGDNSPMEDFTERFDSKVAGWKIDISLRIPFDNDVCQVPASGLPSLENNYDVTIVDQDGNIVALVPCGGSYSVTVATGIRDLGSGYTNNVIDLG